MSTLRIDPKAVTRMYFLFTNRRNRMAAALYLNERFDKNVVKESYWLLNREREVWAIIKVVQFRICVWRPAERWAINQSIDQWRWYSHVSLNTVCAITQATLWLLEKRIRCLCTSPGHRGTNTQERWWSSERRTTPGTCCKEWPENRWGLIS